MKNLLSVLALVMILTFVPIFGCEYGMSYDTTRIQEVSIGSWKFKKLDYKYKLTLFIRDDDGTTNDTETLYLYTNNPMVVGCEGKSLEQCAVQLRGAYAPQAPTNNNEIEININQ